MRPLGIFRRGPNIHAQSTVGLTAAGRHQVDTVEGNGVKYDILCALQNGEMTVSDLAKEVNIPTEDAKKVLKRMIGLVRFSDVD